MEALEEPAAGGKGVPRPTREAAGEIIGCRWPVLHAAAGRC